jgi:phosphoenolpyruvate carboxylase
VWSRQCSPPTQRRQRKTLLDAEGSIARLLAAREIPRSERERRENDALVEGSRGADVANTPAAVSRLTVRDEIENALSYYHTTFLLCARSPGSTLSSKNVAMERASSSVAQTVSAATNRMFARVTASQIASASAESCFCRLT